ncbi:hypothetical protein Micbo1qcDRAFT_219905 [Microdochium bolleyi]|uniref:T6SS Phospholipase effector Tle1-like catalytic domain-containing protein n=1 Tax=Microdochium bolleyi TaxID=196109 RepID=A0A136IM67_9PEZI|nr:hypothetical protein Micbo1qcDRAFT_219905 [Microdochium bolleyi]
MASPSPPTTPITPLIPGHKTRKRLIICCDGTWQSSVTIKKNVPSNVTRLARSIAREGVDKDDADTVWEQVVYYDAGIGTGEISKSEQNRQGGIGSGFVSNVIEAYNFLVLNWREGDKVYCFGFSRGAYTARAVAGLVNDIGIISPRDMQDFPELFSAYSAYTGKDPHGFRRTRAYRDWQAGVRSATRKDPETKLQLWDRIPHALVPENSRVVEVVGVFDTVGSLGVPDSPFFSVDAALTVVNAWWGGEKPGFHNVNLSPYIRNAFHALALDEHRKPFSPTLWHLPPSVDHGTILRTFQVLHLQRPQFDDSDKGKAEAAEYEIKVDKAWEALIDWEMREQLNQFKNIPAHLEQVYFPGVHINCGGGNSDVLEDRLGDFEQIALISFAWMVERCRPFLQFEERLRKRSVRDRMALVVPVVAEIQRNEWKDYGTSMRPLWRGLDSVGLYKASLRKFGDKTVVGWAEGPIVDSYTASMKLTGSQVRTPGDYRYAPDDTEREHRLGETNEFIHPSVAYRMRAVDKYDPDALKGYKRTWRQDKKQWVWSKPAMPASKGSWYPWSGKQPAVEAIEVPEYSIPAEGAKFSRFLTKDYTSFLAKLERDEEDRFKKPKDKKTSKELREAEKKLEDDTPATMATDFLDVTARGEEWFRPAKPEPEVV